MRILPGLAWITTAWGLQNFKGPIIPTPDAQSAIIRMIEQGQSLNQKMFPKRIIASGHGKLISVFLLRHI